MKQHKIESRLEQVARGPSPSYLSKTFLVLIFSSLKQSRLRLGNLRAMLFLVTAPLYYAFGLKIVRSPFGLFYASSRETLRSLTYGFFKTYFFYKPDLVTAFSKSLFPIIMDIGANIGDFSLGMTNFGKKVIAVEPGVVSFKELKANLKANEITNVISLNLAAHDKDELVYLQGNTSDMCVSQNVGQPVEGIRLDMLIKQLKLQTVDLVKIDVQGHEIAVIFGMKESLKLKKVKALIVEVHEKRGVRCKDVVTILNGFGYKLTYKNKFLFEQPHLYFVPTKEKYNGKNKVQNSDLAELPTPLVVEPIHQP